MDLSMWDFFWKIEIELKTPFTMQALEVIANIDKDGFLKLEKPLVCKNRKVKIIILVPDDDMLDDSLWLRALAKNPAFDFLNEPEEDIYTPIDGKPLRKGL